MRVQLAAIAVGVAAAGLLTGGGNASASADAQRPTCLGARATIVGTAKADVLRGTKRRDVIVARGGRDRVYGRGGDDLLCGGPGDDVLDGGAGRNRVGGGDGVDTCLRAYRVVTCEKPWPLAPAIEGLTLDGERLSLADFRGRPVLVNAWAAW